MTAFAWRKLPGCRAGRKSTVSAALIVGKASGAVRRTAIAGITHCRENGKVFGFKKTGALKANNMVQLFEDSPSQIETKGAMGTLLVHRQPSATTAGKALS